MNRFRAPTPIVGLNEYDHGDFIVPWEDNTNIIFSGMITITGTIVDQDGTPIPATLHSTNDPTIAAIADFDGNYSLTVPANHLIHISMVGQEPKDILASNILKTTTLSIDSDNMLDVVDLGTIPATTTVPDIPPTKPTPKKKNYAWLLFLGMGVVATVGVLFNKNERKKMALAGGKSTSKKRKPKTKKRKKKKSLNAPVKADL